MTKGPSRTLPIVAAIVIGAVVGCAATASAVPATSAEVRDLAQRASTDPSALQQLRSIDSVDGRPIDLASVLGSDDPATLPERLRALAHGAPAQGVDSTSARESAKDILAQRRFQESQPPRPFQGPLDRLGRWLDRNLTDPVRRALGALVLAIPGGATTVWILVIALVLTLVVFVTLRLARRRAGATTVQTHALRLPDTRADPDDLERQAAKAESEGDLATAIRLRFFAGLLRLDRAGAIAYDPSITAGQVRRKLRSRPFDRVSTSFEAVVYGGHQPADDDVEASKTGWREVLQGVAA